VLRALEAMRPRDRAILSMCEIDELPVGDVARLLSIPRFTAYTRLRRARQRFAEVVTALQTRSPATGLLSPAALLAIERQPPPPRPDSERRARRVMRAALSRGPRLPGVAPPTPRQPSPGHRAGRPRRRPSRAEAASPVPDDLLDRQALRPPAGPGR
jgi:hypothetical protein